MVSQRLIRRLLIIALLIVPAFWLIFTPDGQRRTDLFILGLDGDPQIPVRFGNLNSALTIDQLHAEQPALDLSCREQRTPFGARVCHASIAGFNGNPARYVVFYFGDNRLNAVKIGYQRSYHYRVVKQMTERLGPPKERTRANLPTVYEWQTHDGIVVLPKSIKDSKQEPAVMWLARSLVRGHIPPGGPSDKSPSV